VSEKEEILKKEFGKLLSDDYCYLSHTFRIEGNIFSPNSVVLKGTIEGDLKSEGNVFIDESARVEGNISGKNIVVYGSVQGDIKASEILSLHNSAIVTGDIKAKFFSVDKGVSLTGNIQINKNNSVDIKFEYPVITVRKPKIKTNGHGKISESEKSGKQNSDDLVLPLYPETESFVENNPAPKNNTEKKGEITPIDSKPNENRQDNKSAGKSKSKVDFLENDKPLW